LGALKACLAAGSLLLATGAVAGNPVIDSPRSGYVNLRAGPATTYFVERAISNGTHVQLLARSGDWAMIQLNNGGEGWILAKYLVRQRKPAPKPGVAAAPAMPMPYTSVVWPENGNLNLRSGPGTQHPVLQAMHAGSWVEVTESAGIWVRVRHESGAEGWAYRKYLTR
jgi:uncharacterized protein YgiM (DUF1202 family)